VWWRWRWGRWQLSVPSLRQTSAVTYQRCGWGCHQGRFGEDSKRRRSLRSGKIERKVTPSMVKAVRSSSVLHSHHLVDHVHHGHQHKQLLLSLSSSSSSSSHWLAGAAQRKVVTNQQREHRTHIITTTSSTAAITATFIPVGRPHPDVS
jgi:hypothetical protein